MPQFGLLSVPFFVVTNMLSGGVTPLEAMPKVLQVVMQAAPSTHFTAFSQAVLYRGAGLEIVWPHLAAMAVMFAFNSCSVATPRHVEKRVAQIDTGGCLGSAQMG